MPGAALFRDLGLFVRHNFFEPAVCAELRSEMSSAPVQKAEVTRDGSAPILDESSRRVLRSEVKEPATRFVKERLVEIEANLERHFSVALAGCENPDFLVYEKGAFYKPHKDVSPTSSGNILRRRISVVCFLNGRSTVTKADHYGGGALAFYGLMKEAPWDKCAVPLHADLGLLVAFPSELMHEVQPVTFGRRFTVVTWFLADNELESSSD